METLKNNRIATSLLSILFIALVLVVAKAKETEDRPAEKALTTVIFRYQPPTGVANPYDQEHVQNTENWKPAETACPSEFSPNTPCSLEVPTANTVGGNEQEIDGNLVTINTTFVSANRYMLAAPTGTQYSNPVNIALP